jgi:hypothetical protein
MAAPIEFGKPITDLPTHVTKLFERLPESGQANGFEAEFKVSKWPFTILLNVYN